MVKGTMHAHTCNDSRKLAEKPEPILTESSTTPQQQASELIEVGYEYICEIDDAKLFRKRK